MNVLGMSVVIPTRGRLHLLRRLLQSIRDDAERVDFPLEILLVDDSSGDEAMHMHLLADEFHAKIITGVSHVGGKRNRGVEEACNDFVLFLDSDVVIQAGTLAAHYRKLTNDQQERPTGCLGQVRFIGEPTFAWNVISEMQLTLPFSYPLISETVPWGPTANLSFKRAAFLAVGGFDLTLPHYGGEDVDLGLRMTQAGHRIATASDAVADHTIETWSTWRQNIKRLIQYGKADFHLLLRHPNRVFFDFPTGPLLWAMQALIGTILAAVAGWRFVPWLGIGLCLSVIAYHLVYALFKKRPGSHMLVHLFGPLIFYTMDIAKAWEAIKHGRPDLIFYRIKFIDDLIAQDWPEVSASAWGLTASAIAFYGCVLTFLAQW
jgi:GT2 family glycosyltransferase